MWFWRPGTSGGDKSTVGKDKAGNAGSWTVRGPLTKSFNWAYLFLSTTKSKCGECAECYHILVAWEGKEESALIKIWIRAREGNVKFDNPDTSSLKRGRSMNLDKIAAILEGGGPLKCGCGWATRVEPTLKP
jgi:hypothetical protein